jgi:hypothetical protein
MAAASNAWEVWARNGGDGDTFVAAFKDKGNARERMRRLKRSHPDVTYYVKRRKVAAGMQFGTRAHARRRRQRA